MAPMQRCERLIEAASQVRSHVDELAVHLSNEQGKTRKEARLEIQRGSEALLQYAGLATASGGMSTRLSPGVIGTVRQGPIGVVAGIVPWNFPISTFFTKVAPALAAGCGFLVKPSETTTLITERVVDLMNGALPEGLLDVVRGGPTVGEALVRQTGVKRISFTGSTTTGRQIARMAAPDFKRVSLELGGSDPFVMLEDAPVPAAVRALMGTRFFNAGQVCVAPKRLIVRREIADETIGLLAEKLAKIVVGSAADERSTMGPLHMERTRAELEAQVGDAAALGAEVIGGGRPDHEGADQGWFVRPALVVDPPKEARVRREETFGPVLTVLPVASDAEAIEVANETDFGLGASVWGNDGRRAASVASDIDAGYVWVNTLAKVYHELPFGGVKDSGVGREHGAEALQSYRESKTVVESPLS